MNSVTITVTIYRLRQFFIRKGTFLKTNEVSEVIVPRAEVVSIELTASDKWAGWNLGCHGITAITS